MSCGQSLRLDLPTQAGPLDSRQRPPVAASRSWLSTGSNAMPQSAKRLLRETLQKLSAGATGEETFERLLFLAEIEQGSPTPTRAVRSATKRPRLASARGPDPLD